MKNYYILFCTKMLTLLLVLSSSAAIAQMSTVYITSPASNSVFTAPATINITATATNRYSSIKKVEFFAGSTKLGEDLTAPYAYTWVGVAAGTYQLTAKATTISNITTTSSYTSVRVDKFGVPTVSITSPAHGSVIPFGTPINITATAADVDGSITKVEFFSDGTKLGEDLMAPYTFSWTGVAVGSYGLSAKATDNANNTTTSPRIIVGVKDAYPPTVSITSPVNGSSYTSTGTTTTIFIKATAADANGSVKKVEFFSGGTKLGEDLTAPYSYTWTVAAAGTYRLTAKATDNTNTTTTSTEVSVVVLPSYCKPVYTRGCYGFYINNFSFNTLVNNGSGCNEGSLILSSKTTTVQKGKSYRITLQAGGNASHFGVWIDYNQDKDFNDAGEFVYYTIQPSTALNYGYITIPAGAYLGQTRMRVESSLYALSSYQSCDPPKNTGETEDYTITIASATTLAARSSMSPPQEEPEKYAGKGNMFRSYPNPFTTHSTLAFAFDQEEEYEVRIYDAMGTFVKALPKGQVKANTLVQVEWADAQIPTGLYFVKLSSKKGVQTLRVVRE